MSIGLPMPLCFHRRRNVWPGSHSRPWPVGSPSLQPAQEGCWSTVIPRLQRALLCARPARADRQLAGARADHAARPLAANALDYARSRSWRASMDQRWHITVWPNGFSGGPTWPSPA
jgi:hypothetical protein